MKTLRLISFAFPRVISANGYCPETDSMGGPLEVSRNSSLLMADYPGFRSKVCWQPLGHGLYLDQIVHPERKRG